MAEEKVKTYSNGEVTVEWRAHVCIHSENCWRGLPEVFKPKERPWIQVENVDSERIVNQVHKCPSGALRIAGEEVESKDSKGSIIAKKQPAEVELEGGKPYLWCACGRSGDQPFCDNTHQKTDVKPVVIKNDKNEKAWLCQCKQTSNPPYCDGTHNSL
ncbi:MAG: (4Fe-4S)-binding protein [Flavobacteriia bacterium]|nr:(4Fe-4S)-binding protein [Flavobacteriia bacterium]